MRAWEDCDETFGRCEQQVAEMQTQRERMQTQRERMQTQRERMHRRHREAIDGAAACVEQSIDDSPEAVEKVVRGLLETL